MTVLAILQARSSSSRLPGKVLLPLLGEPMLGRQIDRLSESREIDRLVLATSSDPSDEELVAYAERKGVPVYRGSLDDVLDRFRETLVKFGGDVVVRLTGDCPLIDPDVVDDVIRFRAAGHFDYASNALEPSFPDGLDVEVMRAAVLEAAWAEATLRSDREHVTPFIYKRPERFAIGSFRRPVDLSHMRWTVDEPRDFAFVNAVYCRLFPSNPSFRMHDVIALLQREPELSAANSDIERNEGYRRSLEAERSSTSSRDVSQE